MATAVLRDLGEREIVESLLRPRYAAGEFRFGDDCASVPIPPGAGWVVATTDPCPEPAAALAGFPDPYYRGWLLATINLSDLAAAGAIPIGLLTSLILPADMPVDDFLRLLDGIDDCCADVDTRVVGGNLKEGGRYELTATAVGVCDTPPLSRTGAAEDDVVLLIGDTGTFWAGYFAATRNLALPAAEQAAVMTNLLRPRPQLAAGVALRRAGLLNSCMDNSDGLYPSLGILARSNGLAVQLNLSDMTVQPPVRAVAELLNIDPARFALGWGDWQLVCTARPERVPAIRTVCDTVGTPVTSIGRMVAGQGVQIVHQGKTGPLLPLDSQRFTADSWFTTGLENYAERLLNEAIVTTGKV